MAADGGHLFQVNCSGETTGTMMIGYRVVMGVNEFVAAASSVGGCEFRARTPPLRESKCGGGRRGALPVDIICGRHADIFRNSAINNMND